MEASTEGARRCTRGILPFHMTEHETTRIVAWSNELRRAHSRLRGALVIARSAVRDGSGPPAASRDILLYCRGFCNALGEHHRGEDRALFPVIEAAHPELAPVLRNLEQDHSMIDFLLTALDAAVNEDAAPSELDRHLDGIGAIMESHFAYEERQLLRVLESLTLQEDPSLVLGTL